jgi:hypothetical protein
MPVVFVHGVNVRQDATYEAHITQRNALLRELFLRPLLPQPQRVAFFNPAWGATPPPEFESDEERNYFLVRLRVHPAAQVRVDEAESRPSQQPIRSSPFCNRAKRPRLKLRPSRRSGRPVRKSYLHNNDKERMLLCSGTPA